MEVRVSPVAKLNADRIIRTIAVCIGVGACGGQTVVVGPDGSGEDGGVAVEAATDTGDSNDAADDSDDADGALLCPTECDVCSIALVDAACGTCATCQSIAHGADTCVSGTCEVQCNPGFAWINDGCHAQN